MLRSAAKFAADRRHSD